MGSEAYSPGPWTSVKRYGNTHSQNIRNRSGRLVAEVPVKDLTDAEREANAHLIAAAPELLEKLEFVLGALSGRWPEMVPDFVRTEALAAIAKARGQ